MAKVPPLPSEVMTITEGESSSSIGGALSRVPKIAWVGLAIVGAIWWARR